MATKTAHESLTTETRETVTGQLSLTYEQRSRSRLRARLDDGREVGILLPRGETLQDGDLLADAQDELIRIQAAAEPLSCTEAEDPLLLARAAYHLGNRHVALQIESGRLCWLHDHVLDAMVRGLGLAVTTEQAPFEPEPGAYGGVVHSHGDVARDSDADEKRGQGPGPEPSQGQGQARHRHGQTD
ncbi:MAG: urease accessory protein UreE [Lamprobacter sp.]|nr:urease accessory protein UreE [Lamprobacter sp.]MEA3641431.1 urease accessory protein UreE [Lamprobacter sp.]